MTASFFSESFFQKQLQNILSPDSISLTVHREIDSTSTELMRQLAAGGHAGCVVVSQRQTGGRGRSGNQWHSDTTENLYISAAFQITGEIAERLPLVPLAAGIAASSALRATGISDVVLKWPNDLLQRRKKVGGILCETPGIENDSAIAVVGLGLNLGKQSFPEELSNIASYLDYSKTPTPQTHLREQISAHWICELHQWCSRLMEGKTAELIDTWKMHCEPFGRRVKVGDVVGETIDLHESGRLLVKQDGGDICTIPGGMVESLD
ncbi:MAG: biotin--[acetyl-CoA-carboxylase] ligase [Deltaproteobacteria bacterium]|nr:biotin--[acetyl-CoA-carboxylase] ligase [Deltaproteobacteria bacterium]MBN2673038.1 biotin--[acetyl-CoA-carboxylase] ligase [Deltaproteobacteria bacterium]